MGTPPISPETERRIALLFGEEQREAVRKLLVAGFASSLDEHAHWLPEGGGVLPEVAPE